MAMEQQGLKIGLKAGEDMTAKQYHLVKLSADFTVVVCSATTDIAIGVLQNNPKAGQAAEIMINGVSKIRVGANLTVGQRVTTTTSGTAAVEANGSYSVGTILAGATSGSLGSVLIDTSLAIKKLAEV